MTIAFRRLRESRVKEHFKEETAMIKTAKYCPGMDKGVRFMESRLWKN